MCRKLICIVSAVLVLGLVNAAQGLEELLKVDIGTSSSAVEPGFVRVGTGVGEEHRMSRT